MRNYPIYFLACIQAISPAGLRADELPCPRKTTRIVELQDSIKQPCLAVIGDRATVVLDLNLVQGYAANTIHSHPNESHLSNLFANRAKQLLSIAEAPSDGNCATVSQRSLSDALHFLGFLLERGAAVVIPSGSDQQVQSILVRDNIGSCGKHFGGVSTRFFGMPNGHWFLTFPTAIS
ncbi:hypothetical protein [Paucibacter sp. DJ2R-2]|uniref:hypothetical protein n=1 Tax=Paucibacter sp. DJ2R-2 TaxID=2893558 RepID=UPI0021E37034|nr:hypothetical protein [Paucibacter sp. DJ2R-2]MCV2419590.1 hypothetical protein [Paucibacter sp. DJ4R-1]MCV2437507.1 hypothetical protein [Paucibacter sp. DJ2R-2]